MITTDSLSRFPRAEWRQHTVAEVMDADTDAPDALEQMQRSGASRLLVGILSGKNLLRFIRLKLEPV